MVHADLSAALEAVVLLSTVAAALLTPWAIRDDVVRPARSRALVAFGHPLTQLALVCALIALNQVLCHAYVLRVHHGDPSFVTRYLGPGWFALERGPLVRFVASHVGDGRWLAATVLRVQAFLELPFTLFAYLAVARMLGRDVLRALLRWPLLLLASISFSVTFSIVELWLANPYTQDDLVLRALACLVVPIYVRRVSGLAAGGEAGRPSGVLGLLSFLAGAGAIAYIVLAVYDALLLYNLAHLARYAPGIAAASGVAIVVAWAAPRVDRFLPGAGSSPAIVTVATGLATFTVAFFVPSLAIRYGGQHLSAFLAGGMLVVASAVAGLGAGHRRAGGALGTLRLFVSLGVAVGIAAWAAWVVAVPAHAAVPELVLARGAVVFLGIGVLVFRGVEILLGGVCWAAHEAETPADEA